MGICFSKLVEQEIEHVVEEEIVCEVVELKDKGDDDSGLKGLLNYTGYYHLKCAFDGSFFIIDSIAIFEPNNPVSYEASISVIIDAKNPESKVHKFPLGRADRVTLGRTDGVTLGRTGGVPWCPKNFRILRYPTLNDPWPSSDKFTFEGGVLKVIYDNPSIHINLTFEKSMEDEQIGFITEGIINLGKGPVEVDGSSTVYNRIPFYLFNGTYVDQHGYYIPPTKKIDIKMSENENSTENSITFTDTLDDTKVTYDHFKYHYNSQKFELMSKATWLIVGTGEACLTCVILNKDLTLPPVWDFATFPPPLGGNNGIHNSSSEILGKQYSGYYEIQGEQDSFVSINGQLMNSIWDVNLSFYEKKDEFPTYISDRDMTFKNNTLTVNKTRINFKRMYDKSDVFRIQIQLEGNIAGVSGTGYSYFNPITLDNIDCDEAGTTSFSSFDGKNTLTIKKGNHIEYNDGKGNKHVKNFLYDPTARTLKILQSHSKYYTLCTFRVDQKLGIVCFVTVYDDQYGIRPQKAIVLATYPPKPPNTSI